MIRAGASLGVLAAALCVAGVTSAAPITTDNAFGRDRNTSVRDREKPEYEARGMRAGRFVFFPEFDLASRYDDNVFAESTAQDSDSVTSARLSALLRSDWRRHAFNFSAAAESSYHSEFKSLDAVDGFANADARLDIIGQTYLDLRLGFADEHEDRIDSQVLAVLSEPVPVTRENAHVDLVLTGTRSRLTLGGDMQRANYSDVRDINGLTIDQDDRDNDRFEASARVDYAVSPDTALFVEATRNWRNQDVDPAPASGIIGRDSDGYAALTGVNFEVSNVMRGEVGVGYMRQMYDDSRVEPSEGLAVDARVEWFPDELVTVTLTGSRTVTDSGEPGAAGVVASEAEVRADYELRRNVVLGVRTSYATDEYVGVDREEDRLTGAVEANYLVNDTASVYAAAEYVEQESTGAVAGRAFTVNRFAVGLRLRR